MRRLHLLITGDYWHPDFRSLLGNLDIESTLVPFEHLNTSHRSETEPRDRSPDLVVIAAARRDEFPSAAVEALRASYAPVPVVALLGSWCEGEVRSGSPWPGVPRVYWHQWQGRLASFCDRVAKGHVANWQLPATSNDADRVLAQSLPRVVEPNSSQAEIASNDLEWLNVAVSAHTADAFQMIADAIDALGGNAFWVEQHDWQGIPMGDANRVCIDGDGWSEALIRRISWLEQFDKGSSRVLLLNFPRAENEADAFQHGIDAIVSKPFQLDDLKNALIPSMRKDVPANVTGNDTQPLQS